MVPPTSGSNTTTPPATQPPTTPTLPPTTPPVPPAPDYIVACYDLPEPTYRHEVYEGYKAGRPKIDDALVRQLEHSKDVFTAFGIPMYSLAGFEADDMLGTIVDKLKDQRIKS